MSLVKECVNVAAPRGSYKREAPTKLENVQKQVFYDYLLTYLKNNDLDSGYYGYKFLTIACSNYNLNIEPSKYLRHKEKCFKLNVSVEKVSSLLKSSLQEVEYPYEEDSVVHNLHRLKELFNLDDVSFNILSFIFVQHSEPFMDIINISNYMRFYCYTDNFMQSTLADMYNKGLITSDKIYDDALDVHAVIREAVTSEHSFTKDEILNRLLGIPKVPELSLSDFKHINYDKVIRLLKNGNKSKGVNILLYGNVGCGKTSFARTIAQKAGLNLYEIKTELNGFKEAKREDRLSDLYRKQYVTKEDPKSCILFDEAEDVLNRGWGVGESASKGFMNKILEETETPVIWTTNDISWVDPAFLRRMTYCIEFKKPTEEQRLRIWRKTLKKEGLNISTKTLINLNKTYDVYPSIITNAVRTVRLIDGDENDFSDIIESVAKAVTQKEPKKLKKDAKLDKYSLTLINADKDLSDLTDKIINSKKLNFSICMSGQPGTGKSLYARYLADRLKLKVITRKASDLLSMWVGGTEANIADAFRQAKDEKAMLIIDEADSFLQNRENAMRSWEISQVNELLTQMEDFEYPFVCTTNFADSLDKASLRRFTFKVHFKYMNEEQVKEGLNHFFKIKSDFFIKGLTPGDFANVKKQIDFLNITDEKEIMKMLQDEVKVKQDKDINGTVGF